MSAGKTLTAHLKLSRFGKIDWIFKLLGTSQVIFDYVLFQLHNYLPVKGESLLVKHLTRFQHFLSGRNAAGHKPYQSYISIFKEHLFNILMLLVLS